MSASIIIVTTNQSIYDMYFIFYICIHIYICVCVCIYLYIYIIYMLLLSHFSHVRLCETPQTAAHQASPSLGFSRQEHWSGLPFLLQCMTVKMKSLSCVQLLATPWTVAYQAAPSMGFPGKSTGVGCHCLLRYIYINMCILFSRSLILLLLMDSPTLKDCYAILH